MTNVPTVEVTGPSAGVFDIVIHRPPNTSRFAVIPSMSTSVEDIAAGIRGALADAYHAGAGEAR